MANLDNKKISKKAMVAWLKERYKAGCLNFFGYALNLHLIQSTAGFRKGAELLFSGRDKDALISVLGASPVRTPEEGWAAAVHTGILGELKSTLKDNGFEGSDDRCLKPYGLRLSVISTEEAQGIKGLLVVFGSKPYGKGKTTRIRPPAKKVPPKKSVRRK
jgi:hypothetical protein